MKGTKNAIADGDLWELIRGNDEKAFAVLFQRYWMPVYSTSFSYLRDHISCEEIVHDIFLTLWLNRHHLHIQNMHAYLTTASRYQVYKRLDALKKDPVKHMGEENLANLKMVDNEAEQRFQVEETEAKINLLIADLPAKCREIYIMSRNQHLSIATIASELGISKRTVENQLSRALKHLRTHLKSAGALALILIEELLMYR